MKLRAVLIAMVLIGSVIPVQLQAQNQKIGFIDSEFILSRMPEYAGLEQRLRALSDGWREEIEEMEREIDRLEQEFTAREILYTDEVRQQRLNEIEAKKNAMNQFINARYGPEGEYFRQQQQILEHPTASDYGSCLRWFARRDNFDFVFDRSGRFSVFISPVHNGI